MFAPNKRDTTMQKEQSNTSVVIITCVVLCIVVAGIVLALTLSGAGSQANNNTDVKIVELFTIDALREIPETEFIAATDTLYKVSDDYYSYFLST